MKYQIKMTFSFITGICRQHNVLYQNDVCMKKKGCDDACTSLIRLSGGDENESRQHLSTRTPVVAVTTPETEALSSSASEDNTAATTSMCCNGGTTVAHVEYGSNEAVA